MPEFIYILKPLRASMLTDGFTADEERIMGEHFTYLQRLVEQDVVKLAGRTLTTGPETMGIVVYDADDDVTARALMTADPAIAQGVMTAEVFPFRIALHPDGRGGA